jgi:hypothetical protein
MVVGSAINRFVSVFNLIAPILQNSKRKKIFAKLVCEQGKKRGHGS